MAKVFIGLLLLGLNASALELPQGEEWICERQSTHRVVCDLKEGQNAPRLLANFENSRRGKYYECTVRGSPKGAVCTGDCSVPFFGTGPSRQQAVDSALRQCQKSPTHSGCYLSHCTLEDPNPPPPPKNPDCL